MLSFNFNTLDGKTQWGGGERMGWHLKTSIMSGLYSLLNEVRSCVLHFLDRSLG